MSAQTTLAIFERDNTLTSSKLREIGYVPASIYGKNQPSLSIQLKAHELELALAKGIRKFTLSGLGKTFVAKVGQIQKHNTKGVALHIEFTVEN